MSGSLVEERAFPVTVVAVLAAVFKDFPPSFFPVVFQQSADASVIFAAEVNTVTLLADVLGGDIYMTSTFLLLLHLLPVQVFRTKITFSL